MKSPRHVPAIGISGLLVRGCRRTADRRNKPLYNCRTSNGTWTLQRRESDFRRTTLTGLLACELQLSVGLRAGGQAYSMIIFFQDQRALEEFTREGFEFGADVSAVAIAAAASGRVGTTGASAGDSEGKKDATTAGKY